MEVLSIEWKGFGEALADDLWKFYDSNEHSDVTICTDDGHEIKSHRILLAICSNYFRELFKRCKAPNQVVCLSNIRFDIAKKIFALIYGGFVQIPPSDIHSFMRAAKFLQLQGFENVNLGSDYTDGFETAHGSKHEKYTIKLKRIDVSKEMHTATDDTSEATTIKSPEFSPFVSSAIGTEQSKRKYHSSDDELTSDSDDHFSTGESSDVSVN